MIKSFKTSFQEPFQRMTDIQQMILSLYTNVRRSSKIQNTLQIPWVPEIIVQCATIYSLYIEVAKSETNFFANPGPFFSAFGALRK